VPRATPLDRIPKLLDAAAAAFVEHGFQRTQMDDVAERLGVSKGTIYRSVESKETLFAAVLLWADDPDRVPPVGLSRRQRRSISSPPRSPQIWPRQSRRSS
jgi:AcrR family transcriptional regulator